MASALPRLRIGLVGLGMICAETYLPLLAQLQRQPIVVPGFGMVEVELLAVASRTGRRLGELMVSYPQLFASVRAFHGARAVEELLMEPLDLICIATPDHRHFEPALAAVEAGKHVLLEKPSVLRLDQLDRLTQECAKHNVLGKVVYHKLFDPDHQRLHALVADNVLRHVNSGYCSLLEPKSISGKQFSEWIQGRNPATYVATHYVKLIDFTFFAAGEAALSTIHATGQRGLVGNVEGSTWDSVQTQLGYRYPDGREAAFDLHTSWVHPENFPGYVEQEVQFRFDNGVWKASQRQRGVEVCVEDRAAELFKTTPNHHYNADLLQPWGERRRRGYGLDALQRAFEEAAYVEFGGPATRRGKRCLASRDVCYNDLSAERQTVAVVQAVETILARHAAGAPGGRVCVNGPHGGLVLDLPGRVEYEVLYGPAV